MNEEEVNEKMKEMYEMGREMKEKLKKLEKYERTRILYIYDDEVVSVFEGSTATQQLIAAFNASQIDDEGYLQMEEEE